MIQFYSRDIRQTGALGPEDSAHCCRVLRLREGDTVRVVDGLGGRYVCSIAVADKGRTLLDIISEERDAAPWFAGITLAVAPTKNIDRIEWLLEKAVEYGLGRFVPLLCQRSERKVVKTERLRKIAVSAMKQSLKSWATEIDDLTPIGDFLKAEAERSKADGRQLVFGYCSPECERLRFVDCYKPGRPLTILIGPEGDFSPEEVKQAIACGFLPVTFGDNRLRTETAALYGLEAAHILTELCSGEWRVESGVEV